VLASTQKEMVFNITLQSPEYMVTEDMNRQSTMPYQETPITVYHNEDPTDNEKEEEQDDDSEDEDFEPSSRSFKRIKQVSPKQESVAGTS
jgi:hypothetical protein